MKAAVWLLAALAASGLGAQTVCGPTPAYSPCEIVFEMTPEEVRAHPNPYATVTLDAEFRSPRFRTYLLPAFWDGGNRMVVRFTPTEAGDWDFRVSGNLESANGKTGRIAATASGSPGFIRPRNTHHWSYTENNVPHLWMGDTCLRFAFAEEAFFNKLIAARAAQKFNHIRGLVLGGPEDAARVFPAPDRPDAAHFRRLDARIAAMNRAGIIADLVLAGPSGHLTRLFPTRQLRERYLRYVVARYSAFNVTWQALEEFESYEDGRELSKEIGLLLKKLDPYDHPRSTGVQTTAGPLAGDGWLSFVVHHSPESALGLIEHQLLSLPFVNTGFAAEDSGAGKSGPQGVDTAEFRRRLWNSTMDGQYPMFANTGVAGLAGSAADARFLDSAGAKQMTVWYNFFQGTRHWELEPYFDVDGGRALALEVPRDEETPEGIEYIVYVEKPGPVEIVLQRHSYDVAWVNPLTGERIKQKDFRGERLRIQPPNTAHDWVLHISREEKKQSMLRSYRFETHTVMLQEVEQSESRVPYMIVEPAAGALKAGRPVRFAAKVTRETRATQAMRWLWTVEVGADGQGYRVAGTQAEGETIIPPGLARRYPAVLNLRLAGMNANGKVYFLDRIYRLEP